MVKPNTVLESFVTICERSPALPSDVTYSTIELDRAGEHSNVSLPVIEFKYNSVERDTSRNTEKVGVEYDDNDNPIGYIFTRWLTAEIKANIYTVAQSSYNSRRLRQQLDYVLYLYDSRSPRTARKPLPDPNNPSIALPDIDQVTVAGYEPAHSLGLSPALRDEQVSIEAQFTHELRTSELGIEYELVEEIDTPTDWVETKDDGSVELDR